MNTTTTTEALPPHGTPKRYRRGCHCPACRRAVADAARARYRLRAYGRWQPFADDLEPVRRHLRMLLRLHNCNTIAKLAGVQRRSLHALLQQPDKPVRMRAETAAAILAVPYGLDGINDTVRVRAIGSARRLQALAVLGWSTERLATEAGISPSALLFLRTGQRVWVHAGTARAVRDLYNCLWNTSPLKAGGSLKGVSKTRSTARAAGWAPPQAWNDCDLDNPAVRPHGIRREKTA